MELRESHSTIHQSIWPRYQWARVPGIDKPAATMRLLASACFTGSFRNLMKRGQNKTPPLLARSPDRNPTERATVDIFQKGTGVREAFSGAERKMKKEIPRPRTKMAVRIIRVSPPSQ